MNFIGKIIDKLLLSEVSCLNCKADFTPYYQGYICEKCLESIKPAALNKKLYLENIDSYRVFGKYEGALEEAIKLLKFRSIKYFGEVLYSKIKEDLESYIEFLKPDLLTYVPIHPLRKYKRGFDHNKIITSKIIGFISILKRIKYRKPLAFTHSREKREKIVKNNFIVNKGYESFIENKKILIFDDILTTGSTAEEIAKLLRKLKAKSIHFYFLAQR